ncbi:phage distal tail protein, Rcc01695 family [Yoonia sp. MH D7]
MAFHEIQFPANLSFGSVGGPERRTQIVTLSNGYEERNTPWAHSRRRYDAGVGLRSLNDVASIIAFFEAREGQLHSFRWKDWGDYKSCAPLSAPVSADQLIAVGDEVMKVIPLTKTYTSGGYSYVRPITKPVEGTVRVAIGGDELQETIDYEVDFTTGEGIFSHPPDLGAEVRAGFEFDVPVRFDTDMIRTSVSSFRAGDAPDVPVIEVRL